MPCAGIGECGADALRFALCSYTSQGANVNLDVERVVGYRHFVNKMWNATRFALENLKGFVPAAKEGPTGDETPIMQWILSRMSAAAAAAKAGFDKYDFSMVTTAGYNFWLYEVRERAGVRRAAAVTVPRALGCSCATSTSSR